MGLLGKGAGLAGLAGLLGLAGSEDAEAAVWGATAKEIMDALAAGKRYLYHSGDASVAEGIADFGVEPTNTGEWITEIAAGATDDVDEFLAGHPPAAWFSDAPDWVIIRAQRAAKKAGENNLDDQEAVRKYGHVSVIDPEGEWTPPIYRIGSEGLDEGEYSLVTPWGGDPVKLYQTGLYDHDTPGKYPFGIERDEYVTSDPVEALATYTGDDLVDFLNLYKSQRGYADPRLLGAVSGGALAAQPGFLDRAYTAAGDISGTLLQAPETIMRGLLGIANLPRGIDAAAAAVRQPYDQSLHETGQYITDKTGSPLLGTAGYVLPQILSPF